MRLHLHAKLLIFIPFHPINTALTEFLVAWPVFYAFLRLVQLLTD